MASETYLAKYHVGMQQADALLAPVRRDLDTLTARVQHYLDRVSIGSDADTDALRRAHAALETARDEVERIWQESGSFTANTAQRAPARCQGGNSRFYFYTVFSFLASWRLAGAGALWAAWAVLAVQISSSRGG